MDETDVTEAVIDILGFYVPTSVAKLIYLIVVALVALVASRLLSRALRQLFARANVPSASIFVNLVRGLVWAFALLAILQPVFGIEPTGFVAALGVTSVALSLGLQDTISNVFGGLSLMTSKVIEPGDIISVSGVTGKVTDIDWRSTTMRQTNGDVQVIPNSVLSKTALIKLAPYQVGEIQLPVTLVTWADMGQVRSDVVAAARAVLGAQYDETFGAVVSVREINNTGMLAVVSLHATGSVSAGSVRSAVAERIASSPWLAAPPRE